MGKFKFGFSLGAALGAGLMWLNVTKKGREMRDQLLDHAAVAYEELKEKLMASDAWKQMTQSQYVAKVQELMDTYAAKTGLAKDVRDLVERVLRTQWKQLRTQLFAEEKKRKNSL